MPFAKTFGSLVLIMYALFSTAQYQNPSAHIRSGERSYREGDFSMAKSNFLQALKDIPLENDSLKIETLLQLGMSQYYLSELKESDSTMKVAISLSTEKFGEGHLLTAKAQRFGGVSLAALVKFDDALDLALKSTATRKKLLSENDTLLAQSYNLNSVVLRSIGRYKEAYDFIKKAESIWSENADVNNLDKANTFYGLGWFDIAYGRLHSAVANLSQSLEIRKKQLDKTHLQIANCYLLLARCYRDQNKFQLAKENAERALEIRVARYGSTHHDVARSYLQLGYLMSELGNYVQALEYYTSAANIWEEHFGKDVLQLVRAYSAISYCHYRLGNLNEMKIALDETQRVAKSTIDDDDADWIQIYSHAAKYYKSVGDLGSELAMVEKSLGVAKKKFGTEHHFYRTESIELGRYYLRNGQLEKSEEIFRNILDVTQAQEGIYNDRYSLSLAELGDIYTAQGKWKKAQYHYQKALLCLIGDTTNLMDFGYNPEIYDVSSKLIALDYINRKGKLLLKIYGQDSSQIGLLKNASNAFDMGLNYADALRNVYSNDEAKIDLYKYLDQMYAALVETSLQLFQLTQDKAYLVKAFETSERSKGFALRQAINTNSALKYSGIPDSLVQKEKELKSKRFSLSNSLVTAKIKNDEKKIRTLETSSLETQRELEHLVLQMEKEYPRYYELKYESKISNLDDVQTRLAEGELFIEYFLSTKKLFAFACDNKEIKLYSTKLDDEFFNQVQNYVKSLSDHRFIQDSAEVADRLYLQSSVFLYDVLLSDILDDFDSKTVLTLVPHREIGMVNFDALLFSHLNESSLNYTKLNYLVEQYAIHTIPSTSIQYQDLPEANTKSNLLAYAGFAPTYMGYENDPATSYIRTVFESSVPELSGNKTEIEQVSSILNGATFLSENATESKFKEVAQSYRFLHLAMHGFVNEMNGDGRLIFAKSGSSKEDDQLFIPEIYNLELNAELVVLSACNSGSGKLQKGEGIMSMARSFIYAGSPSVIMSQWTLPDAIAPLLISSFSKYLLAGEPKDQALRKAKLDYLKSVKDPNFAHPYYWAGLVVIGDTSPVELRNENSVLSVLIAILLASGVLMAIVFVIKKITPSQSA